MSLRVEIDRVHAMAATPSPADHEADPPHPYCFGDDPCICVQLIAACETERAKVRDMVAEFDPGWNLIFRSQTLAAIDRMTP